MKEASKQVWSGINILAALVFLGLLTYVYAGFYFVDPTIFSVNHYAIITLIFIRLFFPFITAALIYPFLTRRKKFSLRSVILILFFIPFFFLLVFWMSDLAYNRSKTKKDTLGDFHAILQLSPPMIKDYRTDRFNVVCLGGSTTEFGDKSGRDWPSMVETALKDKYGFANIKFYNMGKQWYTTQHILTHYVQNVRKYRPQAIIVMENINDLLLNADFSRFSHGGFREDYGHFLGPTTRLIKYGSFEEFFADMMKSIWYQKPPEEVVTDQFPGLVSYERNLRTLITLARADGTTVILMTQPNLYKDVMSPEERQVLCMLNIEAVGNRKRWACSTALSGFRQYNDKIRSIAASEGIPLIDLEKAIPKTLEYFSDDVHYKPAAYDLISSFISQELSKILPNN